MGCPIRFGRYVPPRSDVTNVLALFSGVTGLGGTTVGAIGTVAPRLALAHLGGQCANPRAHVLEGCRNAARMLKKPPIERPAHAAC